MSSAYDSILSRALFSAFVHEGAGIESGHLAGGLAREDLHLQAARADELHQYGAYDASCCANAHVRQVRFGVPSDAGPSGIRLELAQLAPDQTGRHTDHRRVGCAAECGKLTRRAEVVAARALDLLWVIAVVNDCEVADPVAVVLGMQPSVAIGAH